VTENKIQLERVRTKFNELYETAKTADRENELAALYQAMGQEITKLKNLSTDEAIQLAFCLHLLQKTKRKSRTLSP
jgi:hypothetical protein